MNPTTDDTEYLGGIEIIMCTWSARRYRYVGRGLLMQSSRYAHARQMQRARACTCKLRTQPGRVLREIERQTKTPSSELLKLLETAQCIHAQQRHDKNKIYSVHEPAVQCIAKGKADKPYDFGNEVSVAVSSRGGWFVKAALREVPMMATRWRRR
jgi:IS5 family transposase